RAAVVILRLGLDAEVEEGDDAVFGLLPILGELLPVLAPLLVERLEVGDHQVVLGAEEGVEAGLGNVRVPEDAINADHADTFGGEEVGGAGQQALPRARTVTPPGGGLLGGGLLHRSFLCRGLFGGPHPSVTSSSFRSNKALPWPWVIRPGEKNSVKHPTCCADARPSSGTVRTAAAHGRWSPAACRGSRRDRGSPGRAAARPRPRPAGRRPGGHGRGSR